MIRKSNRTCYNDKLITVLIRKAKLFRSILTGIVLACINLHMSNSIEQLTTEIISLKFKDDNDNVNNLNIKSTSLDLETS